MRSADTDPKEIRAILERRDRMARTIAEMVRPRRAGGHGPMTLRFRSGQALRRTAAWPRLSVSSRAGGQPARRRGRIATASTPGRVVAIGDIHGSIDGLNAILRTAGLADGRVWTGGNDARADRLHGPGTNVRAVMDLLMALEPQAAAAGGRVRVVLGNHEAMNLVGETRDVTPAIFATLLTTSPRPGATRPGATTRSSYRPGDEAGAPLRQRRWRGKPG